MFNIIFPIIIFLSFAVIVFIIGRHLPEFVDIRKNSEEEEGRELPKKSKLKNFFARFFKILKNSFLWLTDKIIQKIKDFLSLIQSWVLEAKKKKQGKDMNIMEDNQEKESQDFFRAKKEETRTENVDSAETRVEEPKEKKKSKGFFASFKKNLKEKILEKKRKKINQVFQDDSQDDTDQFSDGIVKIHEKKTGEKSEENKKVINEVVEIKKEKDNSISMDDEIGVDRNILENKLINKIAQNPRDVELYRQLGELYIKMENYSDAEGCYKQIIKMAVRDVDAKRKIERIKLLKRSSK